MSLSGRKMSLGRRISVYCQGHLRHALGSLGELWRLPLTSLLTMAVLGISLSLPTVLAVLVKNSAQMQQQWTDPTEISLFLRADLSDARLQGLQSRLKGMAEIDRFEYLSAEQSLQDFKAMSQYGDALQYLDNNPLPAVIRVIPSLRHRELEPLQQLKLKLEALSEVDIARLDLDWLMQLKALMNSLAKMAWGLAALLVGTVVLVTANTIRMAITQRQDEIRVMKLVGATNGFVRRPFLYAGVWYGVIAAVIAWTLVSATLVWFDRALGEFISSYQSGFQLAGLSGAELGTMMLASVLLCWLGAWLSVQRHLTAIEPQ
ncbi:MULTISPECIES: permease-like cell division protein FtsX [Ferrimonas]|uniref:permease-like cell division protein FtsX n=1 Tax=Ferrimonas TaxID=44011 RepID=UPI000421A450|nr:MULTISPECIES: permease-like cell division protein FtsX [Ferrimonas]